MIDKPDYGEPDHGCEKCMVKTLDECNCPEIRDIRLRHEIDFLKREVERLRTALRYLRAEINSEDDYEADSLLATIDGALDTQKDKP